jgi:hypothetical protein
MELVSSKNATGFAGVPYLFIQGRAFGLNIQVDLHRTPDILAELSAFVINMSLDWHSVKILFL